VSAIALDRVTKVYEGGVRAVDQVSLEVADGELLVLLGPSGCGKTTLLRLIAGLEEITSGELTLDGELATAAEPGDRNVAMVFQHSALYPDLTVRENLAFPLLAAGGTSQQAVDARVTEIAYGMGLDRQLDRRPDTLSGGEKQRVAMGRALVLSGPTVLLMDEPLASLDVGARNGLRAEIRALIRALHLTTIYVTHDQAEALSLADRIAVLRDGVVEDVGPPVRIYEEPATAFVAAFLGSPQINLAWATVAVQPEERVVIDLAGQQIELPWTDPRRAALVPYDGEPVIVGIRPDALTPLRPEIAVPRQGGPAPAGRASKSRARLGRAPDAAARPGPVIRGRISVLEYYGHEWLVRVDAGLRPVDLDLLRTEPGPPAPPAGGRRGSRRGGHRGSSLLLRLNAPRDWAAGQDVALAVDLPRVLLFDASGRRIGPPRPLESSPAPGTPEEIGAAEGASPSDAPRPGRRADRGVAGGGHAEPAGDGGHAEPVGDGGHAEPAGDGGHAEPARDGGHAEPAGDGGHAEPVRDGGHAEPVRDGGHAEPVRDGGHAEPAA
jgi:multiple sugar transport system ATP-binding protein